MIRKYLEIISISERTNIALNLNIREYLINKHKNINSKLKKGNKK